MFMSKVVTIARLAILIMGIGVGSAWGENLSVDLTKLSPDVAKSLIEDLQKKNTTLPTVSDAHQYVGLGKEVALAISETAKGLSLEVNSFVNTPVGWWAMAILVWMIIGAKLVKLVIGLIFVSVGFFVWWKSLKRFFLSDYQFQNIDSRSGCAAIHTISAFFLFIVMLVVVFGII